MRDSLRKTEASRNHRNPLIHVHKLWISKQWKSVHWINHKLNCRKTRGSVARAERCRERSMLKGGAPRPRWLQHVWKLDGLQRWLTKRLRTCDCANHFTVTILRSHTYDCNNDDHGHYDCYPPDTTTCTSCYECTTMY